MYGEETSAFTHKKSLGQNFLTNPRVPEWMADAAELKAGEHVLEVGPGGGALTGEFLARGARVLAVEADARAISLLEETFEDEIADGRLTLIHGDIREFNPAAHSLKARQYKLIANIPYYLSGMLFRQFLESTAYPKTLVFLTQKEVAERIVRSEKESLLSLSVKAFGTPKFVRKIGRGNFTPPPKVDSAIIAVTDISKENFTDLSEEHFFSVLHLGFAAKRKQLLGNLAKHYDRETLTHIFSTLELAPGVRGEDIGLHKWRELARMLPSTD